jgi:aspartyl/asparaginyl-tRNA synthetase
LTPGQKQPLELKIEEFDVTPKLKEKPFLLQKKAHSFEYLRDHLDLRSKTKTF